MISGRLVVACIFSLLTVANLEAQIDQPPIKVFGYFQNSLQQWTAFEERPELNSFSLQQLNLFFQKDFNPSWTAFVNFEFLNNFSSSRQWGSANLEEAWIRYRADMRFNLKLGLLLPIFNHLNEIKNRTPLLPYVIRPLAYETSFSEFIPVEILTPLRAFAQAYGFFPSGEAKFDYAVFLGNSPNINNSSMLGQTGVDTTATFLVGGRVGLRYRDFKLGLSGTYDRDSIFEDLAADFGFQPGGFSEIPKTRLGGDLSYHHVKFFFEGEFIKVDMKRDTPGLNANLDFFYITLGHRVTEKLLAYGSYWFMDEDLSISTRNREIDEDSDVRVYTGGISHGLMDRISLKAQFARVISEERHGPSIDGITLKGQDDFNVWTLAASVIF